MVRIGGRLRRGSRNRLVRRILLIGLTLLLAWLAVGYFTFVRPHTDAPEHADAIFILGTPRANGRDAVGLSLIEHGYAPNLVISNVLPQQLTLRSICRDGISGVHVYCFSPQPATTQGEAQQVSALARRYGWQKIIVVTSTYHVSRARMIVDRCFPGQVLMVPARKNIDLGQWSYQFLYQTGAYLKAFWNSGC